MLDIVINHTSTHHEWFKEAMRSKDSPYRDYYFFRESNDGPPTVGSLNLVEMHGNMMIKRMNITCIYLMFLKLI